jgi:hypothetical protein
LIKRTYVSVFAGLVVALFIGGASNVSSPSRAFADAGPKPNVCGCYRDSTGACFCGKKARCGCPGECEPKGCDEKRGKQLEKEIAEETKKAASGKQPASRGKGKEKDSASSAEGEDAGPKRKGKPLSAAQKKELGHLLDAYLAEHPEGRSQTINEVRSAVGN